MWDSGQNTGSVEKKKHHSSEKYSFRHLVSTHLVPLCVTLAADLLPLLIRKKRKEKKKFYYLQAECSQGQPGCPWKKAPAP